MKAMLPAERQGPGRVRWVFVAALRWSHSGVRVNGLDVVEHATYPAAEVEVERLVASLSASLAPSVYGAVEKRCVKA